jgi:hypothetical protein
MLDEILDYVKFLRLQVKVYMFYLYYVTISYNSTSITNS